MAGPYKLYFSYARNLEPKRFAYLKRLVKTLSERGAEILDPSSPMLANNPAQAEDGFRNSDALVVFAPSPTSLSPWAYFEVGAAATLGKPIVMVGPRTESNFSSPLFDASPSFVRLQSPAKAAESILNALRSGKPRERKRGLQRVPARARPVGAKRPVGR